MIKTIKKEDELMYNCRICDWEWQTSLEDFTVKGIMEHNLECPLCAGCTLVGAIREIYRNEIETGLFSTLNTIFKYVWNRILSKLKIYETNR